jgi:hypothetical protein
MSMYLRPTELAKYLDVAPQKISQLRARGIITPEQDGSYEADATRVAYIRNLRAHVVPAASATLTEERAPLLRARRERMELETARMRGGTISPEEQERQLEMIRSRLEDIPAGYANSIAEAARRAGSIFEANAAVGARLRSAIPRARARASNSRRSKRPIAGHRRRANAAAWRRGIESCQLLLLPDGRRLLHGSY